jgi:uncharacterized protein (TIGR02118 family)
MMKSICALARRSDVSRQAFQAYYEEHHAPLAVQHFPFARYARNHLLDCPDIGFDTISEFWAEDIVKLAGLMDGPVGDTLRADERKFMDQSRSAPAGAEEHVLSPGAADGERCALLLDWTGDPDRVLQWAHQVATRSPGVSLDFATPWQEPAFPARAVLWTPDGEAASDLPAGVAARVLRVKRIETPRDQLVARAGDLEHK